MCYLRHFLLFLLLSASVNVSFAEPTPNDILMNATKLTCTFTSRENTRWGSEGPIRNVGPILDHVLFNSINHKTGTAQILYGDDYQSVRIRVFGYSITFFEVTDNGNLDPVITTVLDDYYSDTKTFIAIRSMHVTSAFKRALAVQKIGTCEPTNSQDLN